MAKPVKTNVLRMLDARRIPYETREYDVDDGQFDGSLVAAKTGLDPEMVYKTLVLCGDKGAHLVCVIPVTHELDLKAVARAAGQRSVSMLPVKELLPLTGYVLEVKVTRAVPSELSLTTTVSPAVHVFWKYAQPASV